MSDKNEWDMQKTNSKMAEICLFLSVITENANDLNSKDKE